MSLIILPESTHDPATNMAIDAALLDSVPEKSAVFRHYGWTEPAITFGYTQRIQEVRTVVPEGAHLCRRLTGGGIVDHRNDWTYALILHSQLETAQVLATELYEKIHQCIQQALAKQVITTRLAPCPRACDQIPSPKPTAPSQCFVQPTANDILHPDGRKIAGAAMKRTRQGLLIQGSIDRSTLPDTFGEQSFSNTLQELLAKLLHLNLSGDHKRLPEQRWVQKRHQQFESSNWTNRR